MSDKLTKILIVIFLTILIWAWAFLSQEKEDSFHGTLIVSPQSDPSLLVSFSVDGIQYGQQVPLKLNFIGTPAKISDLARRSKLAPRGDVQREALDYTYNPVDERHTETKTYTIDLLYFLQNHSKTKELALTLNSCEVANKPVTQIQVDVEVLEKKWLKIRCLDENDVLVTDAIIEPASIEMYVRKSDPAEATIQLSREQIDRARKQAVLAKPFVQLGTAGRSTATESVSVTLPQVSELESRPFQTNKPIGFIMSQKLQNEYKVEIGNLSAVRSSVQIKATDEAFNAYQNMQYPLLIEIRDSDTIANPIPPKSVIFNFPAEYIRNGQIELADPTIAKTRQATIKLTPIAVPAP